VISRSGGLVFLAVVGLLISSDLAAFQLGLIGPPWEPLFGDGSRRVLTSDLSRLLPVPDAALGMLGYGADLVLALLVVTRPDGRHSVALTLAVVAGAGALASVFLVLYQALAIGALCTLCLGSAGVSWVLAAGAIWEERARQAAATLGRPSSPPSRTSAGRPEQTQESSS
jgi:uncharacterized membrane protein